MYREPDEIPTRVVGTYVESFKPDRVDILWLNVVFRYGPEPQNYNPPDWSNYQEWLKENAS